MHAIVAEIHDGTAWIEYASIAIDDTAVIRVTHHGAVGDGLVLEALVEYEAEGDGSRRQHDIASRTLTCGFG
jgi:hypothetical protein